MNQRTTLKRRDFLRIVGAGGVAGLAALTLGRTDRRATASETVTDTRLLMGTVVNLTLITPDRRAGQAAIEACLNQMATLEAVLSRHQPTSQLSRLNRDGSLAAADVHLIHVLREAQRIAALTEGAFDVTVKPLVDLYEDSLNTDRGLPSAQRVASTLKRVGYQHLQIGSDTVAFTQANMSVTLDGIAKGYIVDEGTNILRQYGFDNILVEAGGDLAASGAKAQGLPWRIGIQSPRDEGASLLNKFTLTNQAAATSGDYMQPYSANLAAYHILDPRTGYSAPELSSATVIAPSGMEADALATALMVLGSARGLDLVETLPTCEAYLVTKDMTIWHSTGFA
jgi:FAD:protein FMN transferase